MKVILCVFLLISSSRGKDFDRYSGRRVEAVRVISVEDTAVIGCAARCQTKQTCEGFQINQSDICQLLEVAQRLVDDANTVLYLAPGVLDRLTGQQEVISTTPGWPDECFLPGKDYKYLNNLVVMESINHAVGCQKMCQLTVDCVYFTYHMSGEGQGNCYLKSSFGLSGLHDVPESISGPKFCP